MEVFYSILSAQAWGTPLGIGLLFFLSGIGSGVFFWGFSHFIKAEDIKSNKSDNERRD